MLIAQNVSMIVFLYTNMEGLKLSKYTDAVLCQYDTRLCCKFFYSFSLSVGLSVSLCSFSLFPCGTVLLSLSLIRVARYNNTHTLSLLHQGMSLFHSLFHQPVRQSWNKSKPAELADVCNTNPPLPKKGENRVKNSWNRSQQNASSCANWSCRYQREFFHEKRPIYTNRVPHSIKSAPYAIKRDLHWLC